ncbi:MAG: GNAT family N-acetyltransferase [Chloroflexi bacterium]|nr:GNAT family N-acetyltransferase [Chloroflexota bacterium]
MKTNRVVDPASLLIGSANPDKHLMAIAQIVSDTYANGQYVAEISQQYIGNCHYDWNVTQLIWNVDQLVHHWGVWGYPMRLGTVQLKVAGIGAVVTQEPYRKQGLMRTAALKSFQAMDENGYDLSILRGRHYAKFGYVRAWNYVTYRLKPEEIPGFDIQPVYEPLGPAHMDDIIALYNEAYKRYSGTAVRPTYRMLENGDMGAYGWFDDAGKLAGYVRVKPTEDKKALQCLEAVGEVQTGFAVLSDLFNKEAYESLAFFTLPYHHPFLQQIRRGACLVEDRYFYHNGWQVRLVNLMGVLGKLRPLLQTRLQQSHLANWTGYLTLDAGDQEATFGFENGRIQITTNSAEQHTIQGGPAIARLLIGSDEPDEIIRQEEMTCTGIADELASVLFPNMCPMLSHWDEY